MKQQLFHKTTLRLTGVYLAILMLLSVVFSVALYRVSVSEIDRNYTRSVDFAHRFGGFQLYPDQQIDYLAERSEEREKGHERLINQLVIMNVIILLSGGVFSYALARRTLEPIEEAHLALERFTADASHELRTPLATMRTEIEVALLSPKLSLSESRKLLESNLEEVDRLSVLSERLLTLARLDEQDLPKERVLAADVLAKSLEAVQARASIKAITLKEKFAEGLFVQGDVLSLSEAFVILLDNAIKYSDAGKSVSIESSLKHKTVVVAVKDKGIGIPAADVPRIFERFYRSDQSRTKNAEHGYGLGLALAHKITTMHGGRIDVQSTVGKGSTFTVTLPLA